MAIALIMADAASAGVMMEADHDGGIIWISSIERAGGRSGSGADVLHALIEIADDHDVPIRAAVVRDHDRLIDYYSRLGFEPIDQATSACGRDHIITIEYAP
jgi:hypothetical protein